MARRTSEDEVPEVDDAPAEDEDGGSDDYPEAADTGGLLKVNVGSNLTLDGIGFLTFGTQAEVPNTVQVQDAIAAGHLTLVD